MQAKDIQSLILPGYGLKVVEPSEYDYDAWNGRMLVWEPPESNESYAIGVDPAEGVGQDRSVCQVIKIGNLQHPDIQVAEFACDFLDPVDFAGVVNTIGRFYCDSEGYEAFATIEVNAPCGDTMINDLRARLDYGNLFIAKAYDRINNIYTNKYGWYTNKVTRPKILARGNHALMQRDLVINSLYTIDELSDFERDHFAAKAQARRGRHDDRVMALLIGYWGAHDDEWQAGEDIAEERRLRKDAKVVQDTFIQQSAPQALRADYQNSPITARQMWERADELLMGD